MSAALLIDCIVEKAFDIFALLLAFDKLTKTTEARMPIIAITIRTSINVKPMSALLAMRSSLVCLVAKIDKSCKYLPFICLFLIIKIP
jgi:hypothetical protein